ncbi:hypothetical protein MJS38_23375, partial [Burkholderia gladioli]|uniref:hypothetical protein n=1 Tax=Burkholderia gladioli TaxID=28095 RepID=UPI0016406D07|nr:hypothetical protein [Burkholderia gladioli]
MALRDLVAGIDGRLSHAKLWPNIASAAATSVFLYKGFRGQLNVEEWLVYLGCVGGYSVCITAIAAFASMRNKNKDIPNGND